ncbi:hypothetical protein F4809DRAFT_615285 [Biscogniauxia mediterranea]|nr:hypothetical protein F4809DRAFT_615285 [Biscogniauxia mediterranea]
MNWPESKKWTNVVILSLLTGVTPLGSSIFAPGIPRIMAEFHETSAIKATFLVSLHPWFCSRIRLYILVPSENFPRPIRSHGTLWEKKISMESYGKILFSHEVLRKNKKSYKVL